MGHHLIQSFNMFQLYPQPRGEKYYLMASNSDPTTDGYSAMGFIISCRIAACYCNPPVMTTPRHSLQNIVFTCFHTVFTPFFDMSGNVWKITINFGSSQQLNMANVDAGPIPKLTPKFKHAGRGGEPLLRGPSLLPRTTLSSHLHRSLGAACRHPRGHQ